ncbi:hypothetical protein RIF29_20352 [Crotalaria pallida]|uniref:Uncharacterized protein n=1 Tax=Crotalaria pallida TaxID=3830 RepID=A0AAN9F124_CROPI
MARRKGKAGKALIDARKSLATPITLNKDPISETNGNPSSSRVKIVPDLKTIVNVIDDVASNEKLDNEQAKRLLQHIEQMMKRLKKNTILIDESDQGDKPIEQTVKIKQVRKEWIVKKLPTQDEVLKVVDKEKLEDNIPNGFVPEENVESAKAVLNAKKVDYKR